MSTLAIQPDVLDVLRKGTLVDKLFTLPPGQLARPLYEAVNKVLNNAGGVWSKKQKGHLFAEDPRDLLGLTLTTGAIENKVDDAKALKKEFQAFYTPPELAQRVVELAQVAGKYVLEPSAGEGALVIEAFRQGATAVTAVELNPEAGHKIPPAVIAAVGPKEDSILYIEDFLTIKLRRGEFDRIVMNPPFGGPKRNQDILHVSKALEFLAPGGILVAIMSANTARSGFYEMLHGYDWNVEDVPAGAFKESGTNIATIIVTIRK